jgi:hypothetical protein
VTPADQAKLTISGLTGNKYFVYFTFAQLAGSTVLSDSQISPVLEKVAELLVAGRPSTNLCICSGLYRDQTCTCISGYYDAFLPLTQSQDCIPCDYQCSTCVTASRCISCPKNTNRKYDATNETCLCVDPYFDNGDALCDVCD